MRILLVLSIAAVAACATTSDPSLNGRTFSDLDQNADGQLQAAELSGTVINFDDVDSDADGVISLEEAVAYERKNQSSGDRPRIRTNTGSRL